MRRLLVDKNASSYMKKHLTSLGFSVVETIELPMITNSTASHPDMQFLPIGGKRALVAKECYDHYRCILPDIELLPIQGIGGKYPNDCLLNVVTINGKTVMTQLQHRILKQFIVNAPILVKQGYVKCSTCILNDNAVLSADRGIISSLSEAGFRAYYLPDRDILLRGYKNGFWGGATGLVGKDKLFFNGNIETLACFDELSDILEKEKIEPIYHKGTPLTDNGSIILIDM